MTEFVALYQGQTVGDAKLVALSAEPRIVHALFNEMLGNPEATEESPRTNLDCNERILKPVPRATG
jgi:hypothetical protein